MKKNKSLLKLYLINFLLGAGLYGSVEVLYLQSKNISTYIISILLSFIPLATAIMEIPTGVIGDIIGRKNIFRLTFFSFFASSLILIFSPNIFFIFFSYFLEALGYSFYSGNTESIVYEASVKDGTDTNKNFSNFYASLLIGYVVSGFLVNLLSIKNIPNILEASLIATIVLRLIAVILCFSLRDIQNEQAKSKPTGIIKETFSLIKKDKFSTSVCIYDALGRLQFYMPVIYQPILLANGMSIEAIAIVYSISQLAQASAQKVASILVNKLGMTIILRVCPIIQGLGLLLILSQNVVLTIVGVVITFANIAIKGQCTSLLRHGHVNNEIRATYMSVISLITLCINSLILSVVGFALEFKMEIAIIILSSILILGSEFVVKHLIQKEKENVEANVV